MWRGSFREYLPFIIARSMKHEYRWGYDRRVEFCFPLESTVRSVKERKNTLQYTKRKKKKASQHQGLNGHDNRTPLYCISHVYSFMLYHNFFLRRSGDKRVAVALECFRYLVFVWRRKREGSYYLTCGKEKKIKRTKKKERSTV